MYPVHEPTEQTVLPNYICTFTIDGGQSGRGALLFFSVDLTGQRI